MFVKPKPGLVIRDPISKQPLPEQGRNVDESSFWLRRIADGDVEQVLPQQPVDATEPAPTPKKKDKV